MKKIYALAVLVLSVSCFSPTEKNLNIVYICLDATRFDYVDYGAGAKANTPSLKEFAKNSIVFENAYSTIPQTLPSLLSIFTSYLPHELGITRNAATYDGRYAMIQEVLKDQDYFTYGIVSLGSLFESSGIGIGFDEYNDEDYEEIIQSPSLSAAKVTEIAALKLDEIHEKRFFMFIHYSDPHEPYAPPYKKGNFSIYLDDHPFAEFNSYFGLVIRNAKFPPGTHKLTFEIDRSSNFFKFHIIKDFNKWINVLETSDSIKFSKPHYGGYLLTGSKGWIKINCERAKNVRFQVIPILKNENAKELYKEEVEYMDKYIGQFLDALKQKNLLNNTIIAIFADHGEGLGERSGYFGHILYLNRQFIQVPLILYIPGIEKKIIKTPVSMAGLSSTILEHLNIRTKGFKNSFLSFFKKDKSLKNEVYSFCYKPIPSRDGVSIIKWPYQGIFYWDEKTEISEFYSLDSKSSFSFSDQLDNKNLSKNEKEVLAQFSRQFLDMKKSIELAVSSQKKIDKERLEKLKSLGYIK